MGCSQRKSINKIYGIQAPKMQFSSHLICFEDNFMFIDQITQSPETNGSELS